MPQALGRLGQEMLREMPGAVVGAQFRLEHMLMADAFRIGRGGRLDVDAVQHLVEQHAVDAAPYPAQAAGRRLPEILDGEDAGAVEALLHALADAVDILQFEAEQNARQILVRDDGKAVRFLNVGTDLAEKHIRREADRAGEAFADLLAQRAFDLRRQFARDRHLPFGSHQAAGHLINRHDLLDRQAGIDRLEDALVIIGVEPVPGLHRDHVGTNPARLAHESAGGDAEALGRIAGGDRAGGTPSASARR